MFLFLTLQYVNIENFGQLFLTLDPVWIMEHNFFTTQSRLCRAEAEHRAHTVILPKRTFKKWGHSNFTFQHC